MKLFPKVIATILALMLPLTSAVAEDERPITLSGDVMAVKTTVNEAGVEKTELVKPEVIIPGDRLIFGTDFANSGEETVTDFVVTNPLPKAVRLAEDADPSLEVSVDGGANWGPIDSLTVSDETGARAASHSDVTHVRWTLKSVAPGATGRLEYPAIIR